MFYKDPERERFIIGGMSGTSSDGVTVALVKVKGTSLNKRINFIDYTEKAYPQSLKDEIFSLYPGGKFKIEKLAMVRHKVMSVYVNAIEELLYKNGIEKGKISIISFQGPILYYAPPLCIELSEPAILSDAFGIPVISHLRAQDIAAGGRGAPLSPYVDYLLFHDSKKGYIIQNIGGIANLTAIFPDTTMEEIISFDTGPGNMVIDYVVKELFKIPYDKDGEIASTGTVNEELLSWLMSHPYIQKHPPKTTGREVFGETFGREVIKRAKALMLSSEEIVATVTAFTVESIAQNYEKFVFPYGKIDKVILGGGGTFNKTLVNMLKKRVYPIRVSTHKEYGIPPQAREALTWAVLGDETMCRTPSNLPHITGAKKRVLQGKITP